jgi:hypothetical protein
MLILPEEDKAAYFEALAKDPELVQRESDPTRFLECERQDPWKAAKRLACYWQIRKDIFGAQRAFLPLHQTTAAAVATTTNVGTVAAGAAMATTSSTTATATTAPATVALNEQDLEILNTAALVQLPNDRNGRVVLAADAARYRPEHSFPHYHPCRLRMTFYMLSIASEMPASQQLGIVLLGLLTSAPNHDLVQRFTALIKHAMPIRSVETHIVMLPSRVIFGSFVDKMIEHIFVLCGSFASSTFIHRGSTDTEVVKKLKTQGLLSKTGIPEWMGGSWKVEDFEKWKRQRMRFEQALLKTAEERLNRKRNVNAVLSRQKRARQKSQLQQLQVQCAVLTASNQRLSTENGQLEQYLQYARSEAAIMEYLEQQQQQQQQSSFSTLLLSSSSSSSMAAPAAPASSSLSSSTTTTTITTTPAVPASSAPVAMTSGDSGRGGGWEEPTGDDMPPDAASLCEFFSFN